MLSSSFKIEKNKFLHCGNFGCVNCQLNTISGHVSSKFLIKRDEKFTMSDVTMSR